MNNKTGTYALILESQLVETIGIGKKNTLDLRFGFYIYIGSAFGPGGIPARLSHHKNRQQRQHWHIDYLKAKARLVEIWTLQGSVRREHQWAGIFQGIPGMQIPMPGFGSSDCKCTAHLFYSQSKPDIEEFRRQAQTQYPDGRSIEIERL